MFFTRKQGERRRIEGYLRRICDLTTPNLLQAEEFRSRTRYNRVFPVVLAPWDAGRPVATEATTALTRDICDHGLSVTMPRPFQFEEVAIGIWVSRDEGCDPWFFRSLVCQNVSIGGGFWALGLQVVEILNAAHVAGLVPLVQQLLPTPSIQMRPPLTSST